MPSQPDGKLAYVQNLQGLTWSAFLADQVFRQTFHDGARLVAGAVVYGKDLEVNAFRGEQGAERRGNACSFIPCRDDNA